MTGWGENPLSHERYVGQSILLVVFVLGSAYFVRKTAEKNRPTQRMMLWAVAFSAFVPPYRALTWLAEIPSQTALGLEMGIYGLLFAGFGVASDRRGVFIVLFCQLMTGAALYWPDYVYVFLAICNVGGLSWLGWVWKNQQLSGEL